MTIPVASSDVTRLLAPYPHVAECGRCREYANQYLSTHAPTSVLSAVLDHHDSAHNNDSMSRVDGWF
jgi:hypothetical protein